MGKQRNRRATFSKKLKGHTPKISKGNWQEPNTKHGQPEAPADPNQDWVRPPGLSEKYDLLIKRGVGGLVIAQLNVKKIGRAKRKELASILSNLKIDCLAVVEHHISAGDYVEDKNATLKDCPVSKS